MEFYLHSTTFDPSNQEVPITVHVEIYEQEYCRGYCLRTNRSDTVKETVAEVLAVYDDEGKAISLSLDQIQAYSLEALTLYTREQVLSRERNECIKEDMNRDLQLP